MARGSIITDEVNRLIAEVYVAHPDWLAKEVQREVNRLLGGKGPGLSAIQKRLTKLRESEKALEDANKGLETPWSIGASIEYGIPSEANGDLMKIWRWCKIVGLALTIREAQWVARLRGVLPFERLFAGACEYASREKACELLGDVQTYTRDLDNEVAFGFGTFSVPRKDAWLFPQAAFSKTLDEMSVPTHMLETQFGLESHSKSSLANMQWPIGEAVEYILGVRPEHLHSLSSHGEIRYAMWLRRFSEGPEWRKLSQDHQDDIARRLHEEVAEASDKIENLWNAYDKGETDYDRVISMLDATWQPPSDLVYEVGLDVAVKEFKYMTATPDNIEEFIQLLQGGHNEGTHKKAKQE